MVLGKFSRAALNNLKLSAVRFPLSVLCAFLLFVRAMLEIADVEVTKDPNLIAILVMGFFWFGAAKLYAESRGLGKAKFLLLALSVFAAVTAYMYYALYFAHYGMSIYCFIIAGFVVAVTVAPFLDPKSKDAAFYSFNYHTWLGFAYAIILGLVLAAGLSIITITVQELFGFGHNEKIFAAIWAFSCLFAAPYYALSWVPAKFNTKGNETIAKGITFILSYVLVPLGSIYFVILYAYVIKIIIAWQLPNGNLSYMICGFGAVGTIIHLAVYPMRENGGLVTLFHKYFCMAFLPLIIMLFVAIGVRIEQYGVTESRYAIVLAGLWFVATTLIYIRKNDDRSMKFGPQALAILLLLASFGPWGAVSVSAKSQVWRLQEVLEKNGLLVNGKYQKPATLPDVEVKTQITSIVDYLADTGKIDAIKKWFPADSGIWKDKDQSSYDVLGYFGIEAAYSFGSGRTTYFNYNSGRAYDEALPVKNYDYLINNVTLNSTLYTVDEHTKFTPSTKDGKLSLKFSNGADIEIDIAALAADLEKTPKEGRAAKMVIIGEDKNISVKVFFNYINGTWVDNKQEISDAAFSILVKVK